MEAILRSNTPLAQRAQAMVDLANQRGGKDNISVILLREKPPEPTGWTARLKGLLHKSKG
jgi:serine/threonine protein phosphatase PrpC